MVALQHLRPPLRALVARARRPPPCRHHRSQLHHAPALAGDWTDSAAEQIHAQGSALGIKYYLFNFVDLFGVARSKMVPAEAIKDVAAGGAGFAGFAAWLDMTPAYADVLCLPDPDSFTQLPWKKDVAWLACNPMIDGAEVAQAPRNVLRAQNRALRAHGMHLITGVETEWHVLDPSQHALADRKDTQAKPCYDQNGLMRQYDYITELIDCVSELGWGPYQCDHEDSCGQFELNWDPSDSLVTADRHGFFKYMAAALAEKHNLRATFMPKPFLEHTGNGCHVHHSLWHDDGTAVFEDEAGQFGLSTTALHWLGGLLEHAPAAAVPSRLNFVVHEV
jgi:glutamine synthetase